MVLYCYWTVCKTSQIKEIWKPPSPEKKFRKINYYSAVKVSGRYQTQLRIIFTFILFSLVMHRLNPPSTLQKHTRRLSWYTGP